MKNLLEQLENNEAILLMYLAGELPAEDQAEVEQMLARDPALRAELEEMRALEIHVTGTLAELDGAAALAGQDASIRRASLAMTRFIAARPQSAPAAPARRAVRIGWVAYPSAIAAMLLIGVWIWFSQAGNPKQRDGDLNVAVATATSSTPVIFRDAAREEIQDESLPPKTGLAKLEEEAENLSVAAREDDQLGFRNWDR